MDDAEVDGDDEEALGELLAYGEELCSVELVVGVLEPALAEVELPNPVELRSVEAVELPARPLVLDDDELAAFV